MSTLNVLRTAGSALTAQRLRMDVTASNIANAEATRTPEGGPYKRERVVFTPIQDSDLHFLSRASTGGRQTGEIGGVKVEEIVEDEAPPKIVYDPGHPDADADGNVAYPNIDLVTEMTDMLSASRAYEANITVINVAKSMANRALDLGKV